MFDQKSLSLYIFLWLYHAFAKRTTSNIKMKLGGGSTSSIPCSAPEICITLETRNQQVHDYISETDVGWCEFLGNQWNYADLKWHYQLDENWHRMRKYNSHKLANFLSLILLKEAMKSVKMEKLPVIKWLTSCK